MMTNCGHVYHPTCIKEWIKKRAKCPICMAKEVNPVKLYCVKCNISIRLSAIQPTYT